MEAGNIVTAHSLNQVPLVHISDAPVQLSDGGRLCDIAPTMLALMGLSIPEEMTDGAWWNKGLMKQEELDSWHFNIIQS